MAQELYFQISRVCSFLVCNCTPEPTLLLRSQFAVLYPSPAVSDGVREHLSSTHRHHNLTVYKSLLVNTGLNLVFCHS